MHTDSQTLENPAEKLAVVQGHILSVMPKDLYIPPDALEIFLEAFEGPLDLLLYLIKKENLDILNIPIAEITRQYMQYIELMKGMRLELVAEYLVMAAMLAEIKSKILLPKPSLAVEEEDPRADLIRRLQEYERFKQAASYLEQLSRVERDTFVVGLTTNEIPRLRAEVNVELSELIIAFNEIMQRTKLTSHHHIQQEALSIRDRMVQVLDRLRQDKFLRFEGLFVAAEGRPGVVVTFIAILELLKQATIEIVQVDAYAPIHLKAIN